MTLFDSTEQTTSEYSPYMYIRGYNPYEILTACRQSMIEEYIDEEEEAVVPEFLLRTEVRVI